MEKKDLLYFEKEQWASGIVRIAGIDEAGRGPLAGPVVAAAVIFSQGKIIEGVYDSKKISEDKRNHLFTIIHEEAAAVGVGIEDHETIDRINILQSTKSAMTKAVKALEIVPEMLFVDGNFFRHDSIPVTNIVKGDMLSHSIAAASIIAKVTRDRIMLAFDEEYPAYGFARHKGYGTKKHYDAIRVHGFSPIHRRSFTISTWGGG